MSVRWAPPLPLIAVKLRCFAAMSLRCDTMLLRCADHDAAALLCSLLRGHREHLTMQQCCAVELM